MPGDVVIQDDAAGSPHHISLSGTGFGAAATLSPSTVDFQSQMVGIPSATRTVTLTNSGGGATLTVSSVQITGDYSQTNNCPSSMTAGVSCTITITFTPSAVGTRSGTLTVTDSASGSPQSVSLTGTGADFSLTSDPASLAGLRKAKEQGWTPEPADDGRDGRLAGPSGQHGGGPGAAGPRANTGGRPS